MCKGEGARDGTGVLEALEQGETVDWLYVGGYSKFDDAKRLERWVFSSVDEEDVEA